MRTTYFPIEKESPETIKYLLDTVLMQTGAITLDTANGSITIETIEHPEASGWYAEYTYLVRLWKRPEQLKRSRAKYIGITTNKIEDVMDFVLAYRKHPEEKSRPQKKAYRYVEPEIPEEEL